MIESETIEIVHSNVMNSPIFSEEIEDFRTIDGNFRKTEENEPRETENNLLRELE